MTNVAKSRALYAKLLASIKEEHAPILGKLSSEQLRSEIRRHLPEGVCPRHVRYVEKRYGFAPEGDAARWLQALSGFEAMMNEYTTLMLEARDA